MKWAIGPPEVGCKDCKVASVYVPVFIEVALAIATAIRSAKVGCKHGQVTSIYIKIRVKIPITGFPLASTRPTISTHVILYSSQRWGKADIIVLGTGIALISTQRTRQYL